MDTEARLDILVLKEELRQTKNRLQTTEELVAVLADAVIKINRDSQELIKALSRFVA
jgi:CRISPR/Cas system CSM-associated protein Csm2 small subunit